jgi:hypothetical protein
VPCSRFVSLIDSARKLEQDGLKGQLAPSTSEIKNQYAFITGLTIISEADSIEKL